MMFRPALVWRHARPGRGDRDIRKTPIAFVSRRRLIAANRWCRKEAVIARGKTPALPRLMDGRAFSKIARKL